MTLQHIRNAIDASAKLLEVQGCISAGPTGGSFSCFASAKLVEKCGVLFVTAHHDDADETVAMFRDLGIQVDLFPALESELAKDLIAARFAILDELANSSSPRVIVASIASLMQMTPPPEQVANVVRHLHHS